MSQRVLIVNARFYDTIADELTAGSKAELDAQSVAYDVVEVPGVFEIAPAINFALASGKYAGYIALGCVIRGETSHYDYVCGENARGLTDLALQKDAAIGYGVLTVENKKQAEIRAEVAGKNKGRDAAIACLRMMELKQEYSQ